MLSYVWPKDRPDLHARVALSLGFLASAKVRADTCCTLTVAAHLCKESFSFLVVKGCYAIKMSGFFTGTYTRNDRLDFRTGYICREYPCACLERWWWQLEFLFPLIPLVLLRIFHFWLIIYLRNYRKWELEAVLLSLCGAVRQDFFKALCPFSALNLINVVVPIQRSCCAVERGFKLQSVDISLWDNRGIHCFGDSSGVQIWEKLCNRLYLTALLSFKWFSCSLWLWSGGLLLFLFHYVKGSSVFLPATTLVFICSFKEFGMQKCSAD